MAITTFDEPIISETVAPLTWPASGVWAIGEFLLDRLPVIDFVFHRPLRQADPNLSLGVFATGWNEETKFLKGSTEYKIVRHHMTVMTLARHGVEASALELSAIMANQVRTMLYAADDLRITLAELENSPGMPNEQFKLIVPFKSENFQNSIKASYYALTEDQFYVETEMTPYA